MQRLYTNYIGSYTMSISLYSLIGRASIEGVNLPGAKNITFVHAVCRKFKDYCCACMLSAGTINHAWQVNLINHACQEI